MGPQAFKGHPMVFLKGGRVHSSLGTSSDVSTNRVVFCNYKSPDQNLYY